MSSDQRRRRRRAEDRAVTLRSRLLQIVFALAVTLASAGVVLGVTVQDLRDAQDQAQHQLLPAAADAQRLLDLFINQETSERGLVITGTKAFLQPYEQASAQLPQVVGDLRRHAARLRGARVVIDAVVDAHTSWQDRAALPEIAAARRGDLEQARELVARGHGRQRFDALRTRTDALQQLLSRALASSNDRVQALSSRLAWLLTVTLGVLAVLVALLYPALQLLVVGPMQRFARAARQAGRDLSVPVMVTGPREVVSAARDVEGMRRRLVDQIEHARQATEALAQRGPAVLALREALAPGPVALPGLAVASRLAPAEGFLAGDWFDAVELDDGRLGLVIGDVAGHGPGPAVFALRLKHLLSAALVSGRLPGEALTATARQVGDTGELFATVFVAVIDPVRGRLEYANAGHPAALLLARPDGRPGRRLPRERWHAASPAELPVPVPRQRQDVSVTADQVQVNRLELAATGPLLSSLVASWRWGTLRHRFQVGDLLLAYTDGLVEARNPIGEQYGTDRLLHRVTTDSAADLDVLLGQLLADVAAHTGGRASDDTTVMACRRTPSVAHI